MKLEIYKRKRLKLEGAQPTLVQLVPFEGYDIQGVRLRIVDENGQPKDNGRILTLTYRGVHRAGDLNPAHGFATKLESFFQGLVIRDV